MPKPEEIPVVEVQFREYVTVYSGGDRREQVQSLHAAKHPNLRVFLRHPFLVIQAEGSPETCVPLFMIRYLTKEPQK
jgi:hypothetical protein